jgi:hypothetical protein
MADSLFEGGLAIDNADPEASIPSPEQRAASPLDFGNWLMEVGERAERATLRGDHAGAVKFYRAVARVFPERSIAHAQLCEAYERASNRTAALASCADALRTEGARVSDFVHYVRLVLAQPADVTPERVHDLDQLLDHLTERGADPLLVAQLGCDIGVALADSARLTQCAERMATLASHSPQTLVYAWVAALQRRDREAAQQIVAEARESSVAPEVVRIMQQATSGVVDPTPTAALFRAAGESLLPGLALAGVLLLVALLAARARRAGQQRVAAPTGRSSQLQVDP